MVRVRYLFPFNINFSKYVIRMRTESKKNQLRQETFLLRLTVECSENWCAQYLSPANITKYVVRTFTFFVQPFLDKIIWHLHNVEIADAFLYYLPQYTKTDWCWMQTLFSIYVFFKPFYTYLYCSWLVLS